MKSQEVCDFCSLKRKRRTKCQVPEAEPLRFAPEIFSPHECRHYSCGRGLREALLALRFVAGDYSLIQVLATDGKVYEGYPFGSSDKPYGDAGRLVTPDGQIITYSEKTDSYYVSPQKVPVQKEQQ